MTQTSPPRRAQSKNGFRLETTSSLITVSVQSIYDNRVRHLDASDFLHFDRLPLKLLIVLEKAAKHPQTVRRKLPSFMIAVEFRIASRYGDDFVVFLSCINHGHQSYRPGRYDCQRRYPFLRTYENV